MFELCRKETAGLAQEYGLAGVQYGRKMTDAQLAGLRQYMKDKYDAYLDAAHPPMSPSCWLTYQGLFAASQALCRWPRPSELGRLAVMGGLKPFAYSVAVAPVRYDAELDRRTSKNQMPWQEQDRTARARLVGQLGANFAAIAASFRSVLYIWLHPDGVYVYALTENDARDAVGRISELAFRQRNGLVVGGPKLTGRMMSPQAKDTWVETDKVTWKHWEEDFEQPVRSGSSGSSSSRKSSRSRSSPVSVDDIGLSLDSSSKRKSGRK